MAYTTWEIEFIQLLTHYFSIYIVANRPRQTQTSETQPGDFLHTEKEISEVRNFFADCENSVQHQAPPTGIQRNQQPKEVTVSLPRKGRAMGRNAYLDGSKKFTASWISKNRLLEEGIWRPTPFALCLQCGKKFLVKYVGKLLRRDIQLVIDFHLLDFYFWGRTRLEKKKPSRVTWISCIPLY